MNKLNKVNNAYAVIRHVTAPYLNDLLQELSVELGQPLGLPGPAARPAAKKEWMPTDRMVPRLVSEDPLKEEREMEEKRRRARAAAERRLEEGKKFKKQEEDAAVRIQSSARMNAAKHKLKARRKEREHDDFQKLIEEEGTESSKSGRAADASAGSGIPPAQRTARTQFYLLPENELDSEDGDDPFFPSELEVLPVPDFAALDLSFARLHSALDALPAEVPVAPIPCRRVSFAPDVDCNVDWLAAAKRDRLRSGVLRFDADEALYQAQRYEDTFVEFRHMLRSLDDDGSCDPRVVLRASHLDLPFDAPLADPLPALGPGSSVSAWLHLWPSTCLSSSLS